MTPDTWTEPHLPLDHLIALQKVKLGITRFKAGDRITMERRTFPNGLRWPGVVETVTVDGGFVLYDVILDSGRSLWAYDWQLEAMRAEARAA